MNTKLNVKNVLAKGFSLVEMLVVIAVIGIIAAIAIPSIGSINSSAATATAKRNAQSIASIYSTGTAAGCSFGGTDKATRIAGVQTGATSGDGQSFKVDGLSAAAVTAASAYLSDTLAYTP